MQCPMCKRLRHDGPCEPYEEPYDNEPDFLEMLALDAIQARHRFIEAKRKNDEHAR